MLLQLDELEKGGQVKDINKYITSETAGTRKFSFTMTPHLTEDLWGIPEDQLGLYQALTWCRWKLMV